MLTQSQLKALYKELRQDDLPQNPVVKLMVAAQRANLDFEDVLAHLIEETLSKAASWGEEPHSV
jgi:hypothetical protein